MRFESARWNGSSKGRFRHSRRHGLHDRTIAANAGRTTASLAPGRGFEPRRKRETACVAQLVEQDRPSRSRRREQHMQKQRECRPKLHPVTMFRPSPRPAADAKPANADGSTLGEGFGLRFESAKLSSSLVAGTDQGECRSDYMGESAWHLPGGRRFDSAPGDRVPQKDCPIETSSPARTEAANAVGTTSDFKVAGSNPAGRKPVAQLDRA